MPGRRAVITGIGCLSPNGNGREAFASGLRNGTSGIDRISLFDPEGLPATIAGELKGFDPTRWISAKSLSRLGKCRGENADVVGCANAVRFQCTDDPLNQP